MTADERTSPIETTNSKPAVSVYESHVSNDTQVLVTFLRAGPSELIERIFQDVWKPGAWWQCFRTGAARIRIIQGVSDVTQKLLIGSGGRCRCVCSTMLMITIPPQE